MKKLLSTLLALTLVASLASCGDSKDSSSGKSDTSSSSSSEKNNDAEETSLSEEESAKAFKELAGTYYVTGYSSSEELPEKFEDMYAYQDLINEEGVTISEDGILHIEGEDYQLLAQKIEGDSQDENKPYSIIFSVKGCGFSIENYEEKKTAAKKDYEGFAVLKYEGHPYYTNDEGTIIVATPLSISYSIKGNTTAPISLSLSKEKPERNYKKQMSEEEQSEIFANLAGSYTFSGYTENSDHEIERYKDLSDDDMGKIFESDPVTISESGLLHFDGKDYQLEIQETDDNKVLLSVEGSGFSLREYKNEFGFYVGSEDYFGVAIVNASIDDTTSSIDLKFKEADSGWYCLTFSFAHDNQ